MPEMKDELIIRQAESKDSEAIARFNILAAGETEARVLDFETALNGVKAVFADTNKGFYLVAEQAGKIVGQLLVTAEWSDWSNKYFLWLQSVYVHKDFRKRGLFSRLYRRLVDMAKSRNDVISVRLYVEKNNLPAHRVYEALGMSRTIYDMYEVVMKASFSSHGSDDPGLSRKNISPRTGKPNLNEQNT